MIYSIWDQLDLLMFIYCVAGYGASSLPQNSDQESPESPTVLPPIAETTPITETSRPSLEVATEHQQKVTINEEITEIPQGSYGVGGEQHGVC